MWPDARFVAGGQRPQPHAPPQHPPARLIGPGGSVPAFAATPTDAKTESFRRTSVCPLGQVTARSLSPIARRNSKDVPQSEHTYS